MNLCASVPNVGKALDHEKALALLCISELGICVHVRLRLFIPTGVSFCDLHVLRFDHLITSLLAPQRRYASSAWHEV